jgi:hypothetical protein
MSRRPLTALTLLALAGLALAGCGKQGTLVRPAPLFGANAKAQYEAEQKLAAQRAAEAAAQRQTAERASEADQPVDNAPLTTRDIRDPAQSRDTIGAAPIPGAPQGPFGAPVPVKPLN